MMRVLIHIHIHLYFIDTLKFDFRDYLANLLKFRATQSSFLSYDNVLFIF